MTRLVALTTLGHVVFGAALVSLRLPWLAVVPVLVASIAFFVRRANVYLRGERRSKLEVALVDLPYFIHWTAGFIALPLALLALVLLPPHVAFVSAYLVAFALSAYGALVRRRAFSIERIDVTIPNLDARFDGYRIAHLSDLHIGPWTPRAWGLRWAKAANALDCDLTVVTGDLIANGTEFHEDATDVVAALRAKHGVLVTMGNHDYYDDAESGEALVARLEARGVRVLRNAGVSPAGHDALFVTGIDDRASCRADLDRALVHRPRGAATVVLAHDPADFVAAASHGVDLVLSGHTHGGQLALPFAPQLNLSRITHRHTLGVYREGKSALVVHPGLGTSGPPVRVGVAPAIVEITLRAGATEAAAR